jgi:asparagine synthase (glutamine-hydrolysing)
MWALAVVDLQRHVLVLSRDRLGIKPLYETTVKGALLFASEIKQFFATGWVKPVANTQAMVEYVDTGYETKPLTMFAGIETFEPGCWAEIPLNRPARPAPHDFWSPSLAQRRHRDVRDAAGEFRALFDDAVKLQLRADVPVGVSLSGGLDSSAIYGQVRATKDVKSVDAFSAAFDEPSFDERPFIQQVLDLHGGCLHLAFPDAAGFIRECDRFVIHHDEPVASLSQYAGWCVMARARAARVPVLLSGQGADELFSGYWPAYYLYLYHRPSVLPFHVIGSVLPGGNSSLVKQIIPHFRQYYNRCLRRNREILTTDWRGRPGTRIENWASRSQHLDPAAFRLAEIRDIHLPRLLKWEDRNAMAFGVEGRYPFLDHRLVEYALTVAPFINLDRGWNKVLLRTAFADVLPAGVQLRRGKNGFVTPQSKWLGAELRPMLSSWAAHPSARFREIVDAQRLKSLSDRLLRFRPHPMDERQLLFIRLFLLDRWLTRFGVTVPSPSKERVVPLRPRRALVQALV